MHQLRFRQVHLDFHTSRDVPDVGAAFSRERWQQALKIGHIDSITTFAKCHHGWSYHPTRVGRTHPSLCFDLLRAQYEAAKEIDVCVPIYLSAGVDELAAEGHPAWVEQYADGPRPPLGDLRWRDLCFHSPYLDYLCEQIGEVVELFPGCDGIFLDIVSQGPCICPSCIRWMKEQGLDPCDPRSIRRCADHALQHYYERATAACRRVRENTPVFHNSGHIQRGHRQRYLDHFSHLELESLPTGGWGYDHFPISAKYCDKLPFDYLGMTGKFHTTWGEFGGYKHPNALRYECAAMLAYGSKCSVGDQLHPSGAVDMSTYRLIGAAYSEVESKEAWCRGTTNVADVGLLSSAALCVDPADRRRCEDADTGACRMLLEGHVLFDVLDADMPFSDYKLLILPDHIVVTAPLKERLDAYLACGGKMLLTGTSGFGPDGAGPQFDLGAAWFGESEYVPDYIRPNPQYLPDWLDSPFVMYMRGQRIKPTMGRPLGDVFDPYFNRDARRFCGHQHAPPLPTPSGYACGVSHGRVVYLCHPVFSIYRSLGAVVYKHYLLSVLRSFMGLPSVEASLPSAARVVLRQQQSSRRYVLHLLYGNPSLRGGEVELAGGTLAGRSSIEVIEDLPPLHNVAVTVRTEQPIDNVTLQPQGQPLAFMAERGVVRFVVPVLACHQIIALGWREP